LVTGCRGDTKLGEFQTCGPTHRLCAWRGGGGGGGGGRVPPSARRSTAEPLQNPVGFKGSQQQQQQQQQHYQVLSLTYTRLKHDLYKIHK